MFEDYGNGVLTDEDMMSTVELIRDSKQKAEEGPVDILGLKQSGASKAEFKEAAKKNEEYEIAVDILKELERFNTPEGLHRLEWAKGIVDGGIEGIQNLSYESVAAAKAMPTLTKAEKVLRKESVADAKLGMRSKKALLKYYPDGITEFNEEELLGLYDTEKELTEKKAKLLKEKGSADEIKSVSEELRDAQEKIKVLTVEHQHFTESTKVYHDAFKYIQQAENYARFGEIDTMYTEASSVTIVDSEEETPEAEE